LKFIEPLLPTFVETPPEGDEWIHVECLHRFIEEANDLAAKLDVYGKIFINRLVPTGFGTSCRQAQFRVARV
jgi:hypothetical protein